MIKDSQSERSTFLFLQTKLIEANIVRELRVPEGGLIHPLAIRPTHPPTGGGCGFAHVDGVPSCMKQDILPCQLPRLLFGRNFSSTLALLQVQSLCDLKFKSRALPGTAFPAHSPRCGCLAGTPGSGF